jgi:predicted nucleotidyltransferase
VLASPFPLDPADAAAVALLGERVPGLLAVYRFGSTASGVPHATSDVDLAVLAERALPSELRFELAGELATVYRRAVDLVDLRRATTVLALQVITRGQLLAELDPRARGAFEDLTFSAYVRLNEERRGILERIAAEGTIHGR